MKTLVRAFALCAIAAATSAMAASPQEACAGDPKARGLPERIENMKEQMNRIEWSSDRAQQRALMDLHMKQIQEGMRELRRREAGPACRMEMMHAMMEQMVRHNLAANEATR